MILFLRDARRFVLKNSYITINAPLQLYSSALIFAPQSSIVRKMFSGEFPSWITRFPEAERSWNAVLLSLDHQSDVGQVSISSDGQQVASSARLDPIRIWDMRTGHVKRIFKLESSAHVISTALSPDNQFLASGLWNGEVRLRDITLETEPRVFSHSSAVEKWLSLRIARPLPRPHKPAIYGCGMSMDLIQCLH